MLDEVPEKECMASLYQVKWIRYKPMKKEHKKHIIKSQAFTTLLLFKTN